MNSMGIMSLFYKYIVYTVSQMNPFEKTYSYSVLSYNWSSIEGNNTSIIKIYISDKSSAQYSIL